MTDIHLHIPPGYQLALLSDPFRLTIAPIKPADVREAARELVNDPAAARAAAKLVSASVRGNGVTIRVPKRFTEHLERASQRMRTNIADAIKRAAMPSPARTKRTKRSKPRSQD